MRLLSAAVLVLLALGALAALFAWRQYDDGKRHALSELNARVVLAATVLDTYFSGQLSVLRSVAAAPAVVSKDRSGMTSYFRRVQPSKGTLFTGGLGWIDLAGRVRASAAPARSGPAINVADRGYFKRVLVTRRPFISSGLISRRGGRHLVVMAVPTYDSRGRLSGVLAGALLLKRSAPTKQSIDLGYQGVVVIDRDGQELTAPGFTHPASRALLARMRKRKSEVLADTRGLSGSAGRVVAYATSPLPGWITALDRSRASVFASARRALALQLASVVAAALLILGLMLWTFRRSSRNALAERRRSEITAQLTRALADASTPGEVSHALATALAESVPESTTVVALPEPEGSGLVLAAWQERELQLVARSDPILLAPALVAYDRAEPVRLEGQAAVAREFADLQRSSGGGIGALYAAPIIGRGERKVGAICLLFGAATPLTVNDEAVVAAHLEQAAQALSRTVRQEREHEVAVELQRSLLPSDLPSSDNVSFAGRYHAGSAGVAVGGDWYDAVRRPDGLFHVSVGDVAGRGIAAATLMAQLRNAFRAYALDCVSPAEITRRLARHVPDGDMVTTVCITLDPYTRRFGYALAGHPPILVLARDTATVTMLREAGAPPLGFASAESINKEAWKTLPASAAIVAYTDGLVERRGAGIDEGIERVAAVLAAAGDRSAEQLADAILARAVDATGRDDDTALLVIDAAAVPARVHLEIPAAAELMSPLRHRLDTWMTLRGIDRQQRLDAVLALHEACINATEHGYQLNSGTIQLTLQHRDGTLSISIEDHGTWRPPTPDPNRGRGTQIMEATMESMDIVHDRHGTRILLEQQLTQNHAGTADITDAAPAN